jgi:hypothetical protein
VGYNLDQKEVLAHGDVVEDTWVVASSMLEDDERLRVQRSWLVGETSGRMALVLQFAAGTARFSEVLVVGTAFRAKIAFWPGSNAVRGLIAERVSAAEAGRPPSHGRPIAEALDGYATALARDPWLGRTLFLLSDVRVARGDIAELVDRAGDALPLRGQSHDVLWAVSGGHPVLVAAEWDGFELDALAVFSEERAVPLPSSSELGHAA